MSNDISWMGPVCDPVGFMQHEGECWLDAITEMFLFADGIKEITQKILGTYSREQLDEYLRTNALKYTEQLKAILTDEGAVELFDDIYNKQIIALKAISLRFKYHYKKLRILKERCSSMTAYSSLKDCYLAITNNTLNTSQIPYINAPPTSSNLPVSEQISTIPNAASNFKNQLKKCRRYSKNLSLVAATKFSTLDTLLKRGNIATRRTPIAKQGGTVNTTLLVLFFLSSIFNQNFKICCVYPSDVAIPADKPFSDIWAPNSTTIQMIYNNYLKPENPMSIIDNPTMIYLRCFYKPLLSYDLNDGFINEASNHGTGIFKCNGHIYFYCDNVGLCNISQHIYNKIISYIKKLAAFTPSPQESMPMFIFRMFMLNKSSVIRTKLVEDATTQTIKEYDLTTSDCSDILTNSDCSDIYIINFIVNNKNNSFFLMASYYDGSSILTPKFLYNESSASWVPIAHLHRNIDGNNMKLYDIKVMYVIGSSPFPEAPPATIRKKSFFNRLLGRGLSRYSRRRGKGQIRRTKKK